MAGIIQKGEEGINSILDYKVQEIGEKVTSTAKEFVSQQKQSSTAFKVSEVVSQITGLKEVERTAVEERIEEKALDHLKAIQEDAYKEAYALGQEEGRKEALARTEVEIKAGLDRFVDFLKKIESLKSDILAQNEAQLMDIVFFIASQIAMDEIKNKDDRIISVLKESMKSAQVDENILIRMSKEDYEEFQKLKDSLPKEIEYLKDASIEPQDDITPGGCIIETNFGVIDATLEERVKKVWETITDKKPKTTDEIS